ncbi:MAG: hypothetical protein RR922_03475 [Clostridia bacterium]
MLINVESMRMLKTKNTDTKFSLVKQNIERFFRDYIYYFNVYERDEIIIDQGYLPFHYLDEEVIKKVIQLLETELGYGVVILKVNNVNKPGYHYGDMLNIRLYDLKNTSVKDVDDYFNLTSYQSLYSTFHGYYNVGGLLEPEKQYFSCLNAPNNFLLNAQRNNVNNLDK